MIMGVMTRSVTEDDRNDLRDDIAVMSHFDLAVD